VRRSKPDKLRQSEQKDCLKTAFMGVNQPAASSAIFTAGKLNAQEKNSPVSRSKIDDDREA